MTLSGFVFFVFGILSELMLLLENAVPGDTEPPGRLPFAAQFMRPSRILIGLMGLAAIVLAGLLELFHAGSMKVYIDTPFVGLIMIALGVGVFLLSVLDLMFLPRINEQAILLVQCLLLLNFFWAGGSIEWLPAVALTGIPLVMSLVVVLWRWQFPPAAKAVLYLWYLISLLFIPFQTGQVGFFSQLKFTWFENYAFGALLLFMILHGLFAVRFFLMTSSFLLPRNRVWMVKLMPRLITDEQVPLGRFSLVFLLIAGLLLLNRAFQLLNPPMVISLCMMLAVQLLNWQEPAERQAAGSPQEAAGPAK